MAKEQLTYKDIMTQLRQRRFAPIYILMGEEEFFIDSIMKTIETTAVDEEDADFNRFTFYGAECDVEVVANTARQFPLMTDRQLVLLKEAQAIPNGAKTHLEKLKGYMEHPVASTILAVAFKGDTLSATSPMMKAAAKAGAVIFRSERLKEKSVAPYIKDYCSAKKIQIEDRAVAAIVELLGTDLKKIFSEIDKIISGDKSGKGRISAEMVLENTGVNKDYNIFELKSALATKNYAKAMAIADYFSRNPKQNSTFRHLPAIFSFYSQLAIATSLRDRSTESIMRAVKAKSPWAVRDLVNALSFYSFGQAIKCISAIREFDAHNKGIGAAADEFDLFRELLFKLVSIR